MRHTPHYLMTDPDEVRRLIRAHPWATIVSPASTGLVASHYPVILDESADGPDITILSHFGRPDDRLHELGRHEILVIVQGPHDYISPSWYAPGDLVPTWNHVTAHLYGTPQILDEEENYAALLTDHFEQGRPGGRSLAQDEPATRREARGAVSFRMRVDRFDARGKLSCSTITRVFTPSISTSGRKDASRLPVDVGATSQVDNGRSSDCTTTTSRGPDCSCPRASLGARRR